MSRSTQRTSGRLIVMGLVIVTLMFMIFGFVLAYRLTPAAERWRGDTRLIISEYLTAS